MLYSFTPLFLSGHVTLLRPVPINRALLEEKGQGGTRQRTVLAVGGGQEEAGKRVS